MVTWFKKGRGQTSGRVPVEGSDGLPASTISLNVETFDFSSAAEEVLSFNSDGEAYQVAFPDSAFEDPSVATAAEVCARLNVVAGDVISAIPTFDGNVDLRSVTVGSGSSIQVTGGNANSILGFDTDEHFGDDNSYAFVLGDLYARDLADLSPGDFTELKQDVNLDDVDLVGATFMTSGVQNGIAQGRVGLVPDVSTVLLYRMDNDSRDAASYLSSAANLSGEGQIESDDEDYGPVGYRGKCRSFPAILPVGTSTARLFGLNNPRFDGSVEFGTYTASFWLNFDELSDYENSTGVELVLFDCGDPASGGMRISLVGYTGPSALSWYPVIVHRNNSGVEESASFTSNILPATGWHFFTFVFDQAGVDHLEFYIDGVIDSVANFSSLELPGNPVLNSELKLGDPGIFGRFDQFKFSLDAKDAVAVLSEYDACVNLPAELETHWKMSVLIGGTEYLSRVISEDESRVLNDFKVPVRHLSGVHEVSFRLQLMEV